MNAVAPRASKQIRLAQHYLGRLRSASRAYQQGDENTLYGLKLAQQDWPQIQQWRAWSAAQAAQQREAAELCCAYPLAGGRLLDGMLTLSERCVWYEDGLTQARQLDKRRLVWDYLYQLTSIYTELADYGQARTANQSALEYALQTGDQFSIGINLAQMGDIAFAEDNLDEAQRFYEQSLGVWRALGSRSFSAQMFGRLSHVASGRKNFEEAGRYAEEALQVFRELNQRRGIVYALDTLVNALFDVESPETLRRYIEEGLRIVRQSEPGWPLSTWLNLLAQVVERQGNYEEALIYGEESLRLIRDYGSVKGISFQLIVLGAIHINRGDFAAARADFQESLQLARQTSTAYLVAFALYHLSIEASLRGDYALALEYAETHSRIDSRRSLMYPLLDNYFLVAFACIGLGETDRARECLAASFQMVQAKDLARKIVPFLILAAFLRLRGANAEGGVLLLGVLEPRIIDWPWEVRPTFRAVRAAFESALGVQAVAAAFQRAQSLDAEAAIAEVIAEMNG